MEIKETYDAANPGFGSVLPSFLVPWCLNSCSATGQEPATPALLPIATAVPEVWFEAGEMNETARAAPAAVGSTREWALIARPWISRTARLMKLQEIARSNHAPLPKAHELSKLSSESGVPAYEDPKMI